MTRARLLALVVPLVLAGCSPGTQDSGPVAAPERVSTTSGELAGTVRGDARTFQGVRFAEPPTGDRRWTLPTLAHRAQGTVDATRPGPQCPQAAGTNTSEDCLFLDVTTPARLDPDRKLPVMVWWHGGGYTSGAGSQYDARRLADQGDVIVVTANKRLGIFGYFGAPGLKGSGTFGFADQILATRWAKDNAAAFGGDPGNITVFGQSDGGMAACALLTSPAARGLVDKVASMSGGSCQLDWPTGGLLPGTPAQTPYASLSDNEAVGRAAADALGCTGPDPVPCLRALPADRLVPQSIDFSNVLAYGSDLLPEDPAKAVREGHFAHVPVLTGGVAHEERSFVAGSEQAAPGTYTAAGYPAMLSAAFGTAAAPVAREYPVTDYASPALAFATVIDDASWSCPLDTGTGALAKQTTVHAYEFADPTAPNVNGVQAPGVPLEATHASELPYLFDLGGKFLLTTAPQRTLAAAMIRYWSGFARTGTPSAPDAPAWPRYHRAADTLQFTGTEIRTTDVAAEHRCDFWAGLDR
ncbi:carboxylesterase/lipase family protein [Actinophytocola oryzae]|uniref:Para-nitrobenzyl esterase n=1 Tax=Actinophytocola oryzae TaxID=502181 RepID=A0A4R7UQQ1_9PSEU|nr:carboxylesterase family protein [Actinophytocola oryzae]TDV35311.1 para-nitrobenzyl esterase [Actinophytocola oryzae]